MKLKLKGMKNRELGEQEIIIEGAGIITGWVLWQKQFDRMGWLKDGKFIRERGNNTAVLAANWLSRLDGLEKDGINVFIGVVCDLNADEVEWYSDTKMQRLMGTLVLEETIDYYYVEMLSLWPILDIKRKEEFIELFIQREGVISKTMTGWKLTIVKEPYDALIDRNPIPWPLNPIVFTWSSTTINTTAFSEEELA